MTPSVLATAFLVGLGGPLEDEDELGGWKAGTGSKVMDGVWRKGFGDSLEGEL